MRVYRLAAMAVAGVAWSLASARAEDAPKWGAHLDLEGKTGTDRHLGESDLFLPVLQDGMSLLFASLRTRIDDQQSREGNFGLGLRHMLESGWNLGGYGYFDRRRTGTGAYFNQMTMGVEALGRDFDLRANGYLGIGGRSKVIGNIPGGGAATAAVTGTTVAVTVADATNAVIEERSLSGFDAEVGWRIPVFAEDSGMALRVYGGGYRFTGDDVPEVTGPRGRLDLTFDEVPGLWEGSRLSLGAELQHDDPRGGQGFLSARLRIPFGGGAPQSTLSAQERRMTDPIVRDVDVVSSGAVVQPVRVVKAGFVENATGTAGGQNLKLLDPVTTTGAALPNEILLAGDGSTVVLLGHFNTTSTITLRTGQTLMGAGTVNVRTPSGATAVLNIAPGGEIAAQALFSAIDMGSGSTLTGLVVHNVKSNPSTSAVRSFASNVVISGNTLYAWNNNMDIANAIHLDEVSGAIIRDNRLVAEGGISAAIRARNAANTTVSGNTFDVKVNANSSTVKASGSTSFNAASTSNVRVRGHCGSPGVHFVDGSCP